MVWVFLRQPTDWLRDGCSGWERDYWEGQLGWSVLCDTAPSLPGQFLTVWHPITREEALRRSLSPEATAHCSTEGKSLQGGWFWNVGSGVGCCLAFLLVCSLTSCLWVQLGPFKW